MRSSGCTSAQAARTSRTTRRMCWGGCCRGSWRRLVGREGEAMERKTLTDEFVEAFDTDDKCKGAMARIIALFGHLPEGVDGDDDRVGEVVARCQRVLAATPKPGSEP